MLWLKRHVRLFIALALVGVGATGCGFQPLYKKGGVEEQPIHAQLAAVRIGIIPDRTGQHLRNRLEQMFRSSGVAPERYRLHIDLSENRNGHGFQKGGFATQAFLRVTASVDVQKKGESIWRDTVQARVSWNLLSEEYASMISERDARRRAMEMLATGIFRTVSVYFSSKGGRTTNEKL